MTKEKESRYSAFWLYGILVGLAIKEALERVVPHLIEPIDVSAAPRSLYLEVLRLTVFLCLIIRFYLGTQYYFSIAYESESSDQAYPIKSYTADFVFRFLLFVVFLILSFTIGSHQGSPRLFSVLVFFILSYDLLWFSFSFRQDTSRLVFWWMLVNLMNAFVSAVIYLTVDLFTGSITRAEIWALFPIIGISLLDLGWMMARRPFFEPVRGWLMETESRPAQPSKSIDREINGTR